MTMPRIRTIKPDFFRHELLQDLEKEHTLNKPMLVFAGLWGHCDSAGRFPWRPRQLKLDILPFLDFSMEETLLILVKAGLIKKYEASGQIFGLIETFRDHQRLSGKEAQDGVKYPGISGEIQGSTREAVNVQEKEKEKEKEGSDFFTLNVDHGQQKIAELTFEKEFALFFWPKYPVHNGKSEALVAFKRARAKTELSIIVAGLDRYIEFLKRPGAPNAKYAQGWLNGQRWNDENKPPDNGNGHAKNGNGHTVVGDAYGSREWWERYKNERGYYIAPADREKFAAKYESAQ